MAGSNISVVFQAFTDKFEKKTANAAKSVTGFAKKTLAIGAGFLVARAGVAAFTASIDRLTKLGDISKSLNVSPDFIRGLKLGADEVGESFEKAQDLIKEFNIRVGEASALGTGPAVEALEKLGLTVDDIFDSSPEERFFKVAEALSKVSDQSEKIFLAGDIFGGTGEDLLSLLDKGEAGIKELIATARRLGGPISTEDLDNVRRANNAINHMGLAWEGIIDQLIINFAPLLEDIAVAMTDLIVLVKEFGDAWKAVQLDIEDIFSDLLFGGEGKDIKLGGATGIVGAGKKRESVGLSPASIKSFSVAAQAQSSAAFDQLNPNRPSSVQGKQLAVQEKIEVNTAKIAEKKATEITFTQVNI